MRGVRLSIHDRDVRRWAMQEAQRLQVEGFVASASWLYDFKVSTTVEPKSRLRFGWRSQLLAERSPRNDSFACKLCTLRSQTLMKSDK
jgi:hypothetical protein